MFSKRNGYTPVKGILQIDGIDEDLRVALWNALTVFYWDDIGWLKRTNSLRETSINPKISLFKLMWHNYFKNPIDTLSYDWNKTYQYIREYFFSCKWYEIYDFIEFMASYDNNESFMSFCNTLLEKEMSGYRFVEGKIIKITDQEEIQSIEQALQSPSKFNATTIHLKASIKLLSDRKNPDYRNSIKESISAVEAACIIIAEDPKATLGKALKIIEAKPNIELHSSLKGAFDKLYGYTSDAEGIRHALLDAPNIKFEDAKFMLVSCTAFVNYLVDKTKETA
ncbi:hypothetical protein EV210_105155 [Anaerospora hongkongensis]|uniref:HEPN AbiJ-N-terminal domain-containing protein n=1 Tax=Anaerospora hongkongensis TaxID=244830 RepID=A0A4R1PY57_9FIRM|nr:hypothetical protein [Anaerospora hongkongensis]TCL37721.1 hypothetical protein EV210_105155 [Anaerospora hongkongensis]